jgi:predicted ArsR family transcriptional regulator
VRADHLVTREEAADARDISRNLAAFHLDKLVEAGLLRARYESPADQPRGRGRTPKVYEAAGEGLSLTVPPRRYELLGDILAAALADQPHNAAEAAHQLAFDQGRHIGRRKRIDAGGIEGGAGVTAQLEAVRSAVAELGFEPSTSDPNGVYLANCLRTWPCAGELVCAQLPSSPILAGLETPRLQAQLVPRVNRCCVTITEKPG